MKQLSPRLPEQITKEIPEIKQHAEDLHAKNFVRAITEILCDPETPRKFATGDHLQSILNIFKDSPELLNGIFEDNHVAEEALKLLERRLGDTDAVTHLERRDKQTDRIREAIKEIAESKGEFKEKAKTIGFISFDVRGLKMVNDLMKDHHYGDEYLRQVTQITNEHILPVIQKIVGSSATVNLARDGGDEFSILIAHAEIDLTAPSPSLTGESDSTQKSLMARINDFVNFRLAQETNNIIPEEKLAEYMGEDMPPGFELKFFVASGASTLSEIIENPKNAHFKDNLAQAEKGDMPKDGKVIINTLLSSLRTRADEQSYEVKSAQNQHWINSDEPNDQAMIRVISRNDVTVTLAKRAQEARKEAKQFETELWQVKIELGRAKANLDTCLTDKARLESAAS